MSRAFSQKIQAFFTAWFDCNLAAAKTRQQNGFNYLLLEAIDQHHG